MATIIVTGGNRGIGLELVRQFAARGDKVIATVRNPSRATDLAELAAQAEGRVEIAELDVTDSGSIDAFASARAKLAVDLLVHNAGVLDTYGGLDDVGHSVDAWRNVLMTNVAGPFLVTRALRPNLKRAKAAKVAIISSGMGSSARAQGNAYAYRASKAAATNLAANLAKELAGDGIAAASYHPGWVRTDMGGAGADISVEESARGLISRFDTLGAKTTGVFEDYSGKPVPF